MFESLVNSKRYETTLNTAIQKAGLRALLIQKGMKLKGMGLTEEQGLRALLIQKGMKPIRPVNSGTSSLRALLIQKGMKLVIILIK